MFGGGPLDQADFVGSTVGTLDDEAAVDDLLILSIAGVSLTIRGIILQRTNCEGDASEDRYKIRRFLLFNSRGLGQVKLTCQQARKRAEGWRWRGV